MNNHVAYGDGSSATEAQRRGEREDDGTVSVGSAYSTSFDVILLRMTFSPGCLPVDNSALLPYYSIKISWPVIV